MTEGTDSKGQQPGLTTPFAIVIAGALIAVALYAGMRGETPATGNNAANNGNPQPAAAGQPNPTVAGTVTFREVNEEDHVLGSEDAKVTLLEYSDIECPFCKRFHPTVQQIIEEYPNDVRWVYRHFPLESIHPNARIAANAVECADDQGKFWELLDYLFENTSTGAELAESQLPAHAAAAGVPNIATFTRCLTERTHDSVVSADLTDAGTAGGRGTPYTILIGPDGEKVPISGAQSFESVKAQIDTLLQ